MTTSPQTLHPCQPLRHSEQGFSLVDILAAVALMGIVSAMAVPMTTSSMAAYRVRGDAQQVYNLVSLAKMRAASRFTRARVYVDRLTNTYQLQVFDRTAGAWVAESDAVPLSTGVRFGFATLSTPPPNTQATIGMSELCTDDDGAAIEQTSCIVFNSRGIPITMTGAVGTPSGNNAFYITNGSVVYATTVTATPLVRFWWSPSSSAQWMRQ